MGEENKAEGEKKAEEGKKKQEEKEEKAAPEAEKAKDEEKKSDEGKKDEPPPPPPEIVMRVYMHCEGCARKVRRCLKGFDGVEDVTTDCKTHKVVVKGDKADPLKVVDRVQRKTHRQVELLSPIPKPPASEEAPKPEEKETPKPEEKKEEVLPKVVTVVLKVHMHCEACSLKIKKRIERMKEVEEATPDLKNSQVIVKGTFDPPKLVNYINKRTSKHAIIVNQDPPPEKKEEDNGKDGKEDKKEGDKANKGQDKGDGKGEQKEAGGTNEGGGVEGKAATSPDGAGEAVPSEEAPKMEFRRNEYYYYTSGPPRYAMDPMHPAYPPQIFSDENPNACSIM